MALSGARCRHEAAHSMVDVLGLWSEGAGVDCMACFCRRERLSSSTGTMVSLTVFQRRQWKVETFVRDALRVSAVPSLRTP